MRQSNELRVRAGGRPPTMEDIEHSSDRGRERLGEQGSLLAKSAIVKAIDFAVVLPCHVTAVLGDEILLDEVVVLCVGTPFRVLEGRDRIAVSAVDANRVLGTSERNCPDIAAFFVAIC